MLRKVHLDGELAEKYGKTFTMDVNNFQDAVKLFDCNFPGFREYLAECEQKGIGFLCQVGDNPLEEEKELILKLGKGDLYISPRPAGSKGALKIIAAVILVALIIINPASLFYVAGSGLTTAGLLVAGFAASLAIAGLAEIMAPDPATDAGYSQDNSYLFQGSGQTIIEGDPVPVLYGNLRVPGKLISFDIRNQGSYYTNTGANIASGIGAGGAEATGTSRIVSSSGTHINPFAPGQTIFTNKSGVNTGGDTALLVGE